MGLGILLLDIVAQEEVQEVQEEVLVVQVQEEQERAAVQEVQAAPAPVPAPACAPVSIPVLQPVRETSILIDVDEGSPVGGGEEGEEAECELAYLDSPSPSPRLGQDRESEPRTSFDLAFDLDALRTTAPEGRLVSDMS